MAGAPSGELIFKMAMTALATFVLTAVVLVFSIKQPAWVKSQALRIWKMEKRDQKIVLEPPTKQTGYYPFREPSSRRSKRLKTSKSIRR